MIDLWCYRPSESTHGAQRAKIYY